MPRKAKPRRDQKIFDDLYELVGHYMSLRHYLAIDGWEFPSPPFLSRRRCFHLMDWLWRRMEYMHRLFDKAPHRFEADRDPIGGSKLVMRFHRDNYLIERHEEHIATAKRNRQRNVKGFAVGELSRELGIPVSTLQKQIIGAKENLKRWADMSAAMRKDGLEPGTEDDETSNRYMRRFFSPK
jgi:hypothetical protein